MSTKDELIGRLTSSRESFLKILEDLDESLFEEPGVAGDWSLKDILVHLSIWEAELVRLLWQAENGRKPDTAQTGPIPVDELNRRWYLENKGRPLPVAWKDFHAVRRQTIRRVGLLSEAALTEPDYFAWQGGEPLAKWIASDTCEHESEHAEDIRAWRQSRGV
jgi:hypothetical protein